MHLTILTHGTKQHAVMFATLLISFKQNHFLEGRLHLNSFHKRAFSISGATNISDNGDVIGGFVRLCCGEKIGTIGDTYPLLFLDHLVQFTLE